MIQVHIHQHVILLMFFGVARSWRCVVDLWWCLLIVVFCGGHFGGQKFDRYIYIYIYIFSLTCRYWSPGNFRYYLLASVTSRKEVRKYTTTLQSSKHGTSAIWRWNPFLESFEIHRNSIRLMCTNSSHFQFFSPVNTGYCYYFVVCLRYILHSFRIYHIII